jgi:hypothetical protein
VTEQTRLITLKALTATKLMSTQAKLAVLLAKEKGLRDNLANLAAQRQQSLTLGSDPAAAASANVRWHKWMNEKRAMINIELAEVLGRKTEAQFKLRRAFGKDQALLALISQESKKEQKRQEKRVT